MDSNHCSADGVSLSGFGWVDVLSAESKSIFRANDGMRIGLSRIGARSMQSWRVFHFRKIPYSFSDCGGRGQPLCMNF